MLRGPIIKDQRAAGTLIVDDKAEAEEVDHDWVDGGCLFEGQSNRWDIITTQ